MCLIEGKSYGFLSSAGDGVWEVEEKSDPADSHEASLRNYFYHFSILCQGFHMQKNCGIQVEHEGLYIYIIIYFFF